MRKPGGNIWGLIAAVCAGFLILTGCGASDVPASTAAPESQSQQAGPEIAHAPGEEYAVGYWFMIGNTDVRNLPVGSYNGVEYLIYQDAIINGVTNQPLLIEKNLVGNGTTGGMMPAKVCWATVAIDTENGDTGIVVAVDEDKFGGGVRALNIAGATNYRSYTYANGTLTCDGVQWNITENTNFLIGRKFIMQPGFDFLAENGELPASGHCVVFPTADSADTAQFVVVNTYSDFTVKRADAAPQLPPVPEGLDMTFKLSAEHIDTETVKGLGYWLYTPAQATENMPMILYLHGGGIKGNDLDVFYKNATVLEYMAEGRIHVPAYIVVPQLPGNQDGWKSIGSTLDELLDYIVETYHVDADRISMMGHSMGGIGTFDLAAAYPERFCSIAPMSGIMDSTSANLQALENVPTWCFVGSADTMVKPARSVPFMNELMKINTEAKLTEIDGAGHGDVFMHVISLDEYDIFSWLLSFRK